MMPEVTLMAILVIVFIADFCSAVKPGEIKRRSWFNPFVCVLMLAHIVINIFPTSATTCFGGMYYTNASVGVIKTILAVGTLIVLIQSHEWMQRSDTSFKEGEFYLLLISTLLGMNMMVSANHFLLFFLHFFQLLIHHRTTSDLILSSLQPPLSLPNHFPAKTYPPLYIISLRSFLRLLWYPVLQAISLFL